MFEFNQLTWFLYAADVLTGMSSFTAAVFGIVFIAGGLGLFVWYFLSKASYDLSEVAMKYREEFSKMSERYRYLDDRHLPKINFIPAPPRLAWVVWIVSFTLLFMSALVPGKVTLYMMAGSEAAEMIITDDYTREIIDDIQQFIKQEIKSLKGP